MITKDFFYPEIERLFAGFKQTATTERLDALYQRLKHVEQVDLHEAVTVLLCSSHFPRSLDIILNAVETASTNRRRMSVTTDRQQAPELFVRMLSGPELLEVLEEHVDHGSPVARAWLARREARVTR